MNEEPEQKTQTGTTTVDADVTPPNRPATQPGQQPYRKALPVRQDVSFLHAAFPALAPNQIIKHEEIREAVPHIKPQSARYTTVVKAWRREVMETKNLMLGAHPGIGLIVLTPSQRIGWSGRTYDLGMRQVVRAGQVAKTTAVAELSDQEKATRNHLVNTSAALLLTAESQARKLELPTPTANGRGRADRKAAE
jgi:hypothetical protein